MEKINLKKTDVVSSPKDSVQDAIIIEANKTTWAEIIDPEKISKFEEPDKEIVQVKYEVLYEGRHIKGEDTLNYFDKPMDNSRLGQFLLKYETFDAGTKIKIVYDSKGIGKIKVD